MLPFFAVACLMFVHPQLCAPSQFVLPALHPLNNMAVPEASVSFPFILHDLSTRYFVKARAHIHISRYFGCGIRKRMLRYGFHNRSTFQQMTEYFAFDSFICREISVLEIEAYYLICGQPPHPGPTHHVWCAFCTTSKHMDVDPSGFHDSPKCHKRVYNVPPNHIRPEFTFDGVCLWVPNNQGFGWYVKVKPIRPQVPSHLVPELKGAVTFICHAAFQRVTTFKDHKQLTTRGISSGQTQRTAPNPSSCSDTNAIQAFAHAESQTELAHLHELQASTASRLKSVESEKAALLAQLSEVLHERDLYKNNLLIMKTENAALCTKLETSETDRATALCKVKHLKQELKALKEKQRPAPGLAQQQTMAKFLSTTGRKGTTLAVLPATRTPSEVYKALKITHDPVTRKSISTDMYKTTFEGPLNQFSERRLRTLMSGLHYPVSQVLKAFHSDSEELLRLYARTREIHGQCATSVLQSSAVLQMSGMKKIIAAYNSAPSTTDRKQILSIFSTLFSYADLQSCEDFNPPVSRFAFGEANHHANAWGVACRAPDPVHVSVRIPTETLTEVMQHIMKPMFIQQVAFGSKDITLSDKTTLKVSKLQRKQLRERMWDHYEAEHTDNEGNYSGVSRSIYLEAVNLATSCDQKSLAALDNTSVRFGQDNFKRMRELIQHLSTWNPDALGTAKQESLKTEVDAIESFYKYDFEAHLCQTSSCATHCRTYAFGSLGAKFSDKCPPSCGLHEKRCAQCDRLPLFLQNLEVILGPPPPVPASPIIAPVVQQPSTPTAPQKSDLLPEGNPLRQWMPTGLPASLLGGANQPSSVTEAVQIMGKVASLALTRMTQHQQNSQVCMQAC